MVVVLWAAAVYAQAPATVIIQGRVTDPAGLVIGGVTVRLKHADKPAQETKTSTDGSFVFRGLDPGDYTLTAENAALQSSPLSVHAVQPETEHVTLVIGATGSAPAAAMEFADKPNFTIAGVTDWTAAGGHGSDAVLRTSEALNREALNLKPGTTAAAPQLSPQEWRQREAALRAALNSAPHNFDANHELGEFYLKADKFTEAAPLLEAAYSINPEDFQNEYDLALALNNSGELHQAQDHVQKLLGRRDSADVHRLAGELDEKLGQPLAAVHQFERAVRQDPSEQNYFEWGSELLLHRAVWQAKDVFSAGIKAFPHSERMLTALGAALFAGALYDEAAQRLCQASDLNPAGPEPYIFLGKVEISSPDPLPCVEQKLARFVALRPEDPLANYYYAMALWKQKGKAEEPATLERVETLLAKAVRIDPKCSVAYLQLGVIQATHGDYARAIDFYSKAIAVDPQLSEAHYRLGVAYDRTGNQQKAVEQFRLHDQIEKQQAAAVEKERREIKQFVVVDDALKSGPAPQ